MALIQCWECGGQVSDQAVACPRCGAPQQPVAPVARRCGRRWLRRTLIVLGLSVLAVLIARRQGLIDDEVILRVRAGVPDSWASLPCSPLQRFANVGDSAT